jgi:hypothetical protein
MKKAVKKALALALAVVVAVGAVQTPVAASSSPTTVTRQPVAQTNVTASATTKGEEPVVETGNTHASGNVTVTSVTETDKSVVTIPSKTTFNGVTYTVTNIGANTFENATEATRVVIPKTVKRINKQGFSGLAKTVKTITFNTTKAPQVAKTAFKGTSTKKITITVPKSMSKKELKKFKAALKAAGFKGTVKQRTK